MSSVLKSLMSKKSKNSKNSALSLPVILISFSLLCFVAAYYLNSNTSFRLVKNVTAQGGVIGPVIAKKENSVFEFKAYQDLNYGQSNYVSADLLDSNKQYLFSFGKELWAETGYDSEGTWYEKETDVSSKFTIKKPGVYYLRLKSETSDRIQSNIKVVVTSKRGSGLPHTVAGIISLILGFAIYSIREKVWEK